MNYKELCYSVQDIAREAGNFIRTEGEKVTTEDIEFKGATSLVTYVDKTAEANIVTALRRLIPEAGYVTEEGTAGSNNEKFTWVIDPLDGTTNFLHGIAPHSVSIGLLEDGIPVIGVVYEVKQDEMFYAWKDSPAFLNGKEIKVSPTKDLQNALIGTGFPYYDFDRVDNYIAAMKELMKKTRGLRRFGSAAVDLSYVAAGRFNAFYEHALHAWDVAAGAFIVQQAGGKVTDFNGGQNWLFGGEIVAAAGNVFDDFYSIVNKHLGE